MNISDLQKLTDWLIDGARSAPTPPRMMAETCERMVQAGLPLWRVGVFIRTLHPDIFGRNFFWRPREEVEMGTVDFDVLDSPGFINSPLAIVFTEGKEVRGRLDELQSGRFPIFADLHAEGVTDYIAMPLLFIDGSIHASSWTTKQPGGFSDEQMSALRSLIAPLARVIEIVSLRRTASLLLDTYVGNRAGAGFSAAKFAAATPIPWMPRSGCRICAASPRFRTGCRPRRWSRFSIAISTARSMRSGIMAGRC